MHNTSSNGYAGFLKSCTVTQKKRSSLRAERFFCVLQVPLLWNNGPDSGLNGAYRRRLRLRDLNGQLAVRFVHRHH